MKQNTKKEKFFPIYRSFQKLRIGKLRIRNNTTKVVSAIDSEQVKQLNKRVNKMYQFHTQL